MTGGGPNSYPESNFINCFQGFLQNNGNFKKQAEKSPLLFNVLAMPEQGRMPQEKEPQT